MEVKIYTEFKDAQTALIYHYLYFATDVYIKLDYLQPKISFAAIF